MINVKGVIVPNEEKWLYDWFELESVCPKDVAEGLSEANGNPVVVEINSGGGDVYAGSEIYTALKAYRGKLLIRVVGLAASAASVVMCAGESEITPTGMVMIHNASIYGVSGDYHEMDSASLMLQSANKAISAAYERKTGKTQAEILAAMDSEKWMSGAEAAAFGIADRVMSDTVKIAAAFGAPMLPPGAVEKLKGLLKEPGKDKEKARQEEQELLNKLKKGAVIE